MRVACDPSAAGSGCAMTTPSGRATLSPVDLLALDVEYARGRSLGLDLAILARTLPTVARGVGSA